MKFFKKFLICLIFLPNSISAGESFYSNTWMGIDYQLFINDKELLKNGYMYKFRTRYQSDSRTKISEWRIADCLKSTIDGKLITALDRYGFEDGESALIREICGERF